VLQYANGTWFIWVVASQSVAVLAATLEPEVGTGRRELIPALVAAGVWRHVVHHVPLRYEAPLWSIVFPLGMYGVAGDYLGQADQLPLVAAIGADESWVALVAWLLTFLAMLRHLVRTVLPTGTPWHGAAGAVRADGR
jgi:tellurite resistance protein TehA-like permease